MQRLVGGVTQGAAAAAALHEDGASWAWGEAAGAGHWRRSYMLLVSAGGVFVFIPMWKVIFGNANIFVAGFVGMDEN